MTPQEKDQAIKDVIKRFGVPQIVIRPIRSVNKSEYKRKYKKLVKEIIADHKVKKLSK